MLRVVHDRDVADLRAPDFTLEDLLEQWRSSAFDLEADAVLAEDATGTITGYAMLWIPGALAVVDPAREGEGMEPALLEWCERRARERGRASHRQWVAERNAVLRDLLEQSGYRYLRSFWRLSCTLDRPAPAPPPPPGIAIDAVTPKRDADDLYRVTESAFSNVPGWTAESFAEFREEHLESHDFDPSLSRAARRAGAVVGFTLVRRWQDGVGFIDLLAVDPAEQGRGLGTTLLRSAFEQCAASGLLEAQLGVASDNAGALRIYERAGMAQRFRAEVFEKPA